MMTLVLSALAVALVAAILATHRSLSDALTRPRTPPPERLAYPSLTVVRPIKGLDVGARENLEALLALSYPGKWEVLLVLDDEHDPAWRLTMQVAATHRARGVPVEVLLAGRPPAGRTGKLHAMMQGVSRAKGALVAFNDSDSRPGPQLWRVLVDELLSRPQAGDVFAPVVAVPATAMTVGDVGCVLLLNAWYGPAAALAAGVPGGLPFIMGQAMVLRRDALEAIGGLSCADGHLVDDMWLGRCMARSGRQNVQVREALPIVVGGLSFGAFLQTFRRWLLFSQGGLPPAFVRPQWVRGALWGAALALAGVGLAARQPWGAALPLVALGTFTWSTLSLQRRCGGARIPARHAWMAAVMPLVGGAVLLSTLVCRRVRWRGRSYALDGSARLAPAPVAVGRVLRSTPASRGD